MSFSFFTKPSTEPSKRLTIVGRCFQYAGLVLGARLLVTATVLPLLDTYRLPPWLFPPDSQIFELLHVASLFIIGRALIRRQRWGAYLAGFTLAAPLVRQLLLPDKPILSIPGIVGATLALGALVTVWDELGSERDAEFSISDDDDSVKILARNRGFGENHRTAASVKVEQNS